MAENSTAASYRPRLDVMDVRGSCCAVRVRLANSGSAVAFFHAFRPVRWDTLTSWNRVPEWWARCGRESMKPGLVLRRVARCSRSAMNASRWSADISKMSMNVTAVSGELAGRLWQVAWESRSEQGSGPGT